MKHGPTKLTLTVLLLLASSMTSQACRCEKPAKASVAYDEADLVVLGDVEKIEGDLQTNEGQSVLLKTQKFWKQPVESHLQISNRTTCAAELETGKTYLLFLRIRPGKPDLFANKCFGNLTGKAAIDAAKAFPEGTSVAE